MWQILLQLRKVVIDGSNPFALSGIPLGIRRHLGILRAIAPHANNSTAIAIDHIGAHIGHVLTGRHALTVRLLHLAQLLVQIVLERGQRGAVVGNRVAASSKVELLSTEIVCRRCGCDERRHG